MAGRYERWLHVLYLIIIWQYIMSSFASWVVADESNLTEISTTQTNKHTESNTNLSTAFYTKPTVSTVLINKTQERELPLNIKLTNTTSNVDTPHHGTTLSEVMSTFSHAETVTIQSKIHFNNKNTIGTIRNISPKSPSSDSAKSEIVSDTTPSDWVNQNETDHTDWLIQRETDHNDSQQNFSHSNEFRSTSFPVIVEYMHYVLMPLFLIVGLVGNTFNVIIMLSEKFRGMTTSLIIICLALSDTTFILTAPFVEDYVVRWIGIDLKSLSDIGCKVFYGMLRFSKMTSSWFVVLIAFERFVAVWFPFHVRMICSRRNIKIAIACICVVIFFYICGWTTVSGVDATGLCVPFCCDKTDGSTPRGLIIGFTLLYGFVPSTVLLFLTVAIIGRLCHHRRRRAKMTSDPTAKSAAPNRIGMLISIPIAYIVLVMPAWVGVNLANNRIRTTLYEDEFQFLQEVVGLLQQVNFSINFFLYIAFSRCYRERLMSIVCRIRK